MKKSLLSLALLAGAAIPSQAQTALYTCEFGPDYNAKGVTAYYNSEFNVTYPKRTGSTWVVKNYSNNNTYSSGNGTWTYIKAGHQSTGTTSTIVNRDAYSQKIAKVVITIDKIASISGKSVEDYISSVALYIGDEQSVTSSTATATVEFDVADFPSTVIGNSATPYELTFVIPKADQAEDMFYSFSMTFPSDAGASGIVWVSKLEYFGESTKESAAIEFPETSYTAVLGKTFESPKATTESDGAITYSSSNTAVATVDAESGEVSLHDIGSAVITATSAETDSYDEGQGSYTLTVIHAGEGSTAIDAVAVDCADAPVEYYNLQGIRVTNPANGIFIKLQGSSATKVSL